MKDIKSEGIIDGCKLLCQLKVIDKNGSLKIQREHGLANSYYSKAELLTWVAVIVSDYLRV